MPATVNVQRVAAWQCAPLPAGEPDPVAANLARLDDACARAAAAGADVLVTPELFTTGYGLPRERLAALAEPLVGPTLRAAGAVAARHGVAVVLGHPELRPGGRVANAATLLDATGRVVGTHRKVHLFGDHDATRFVASAAVPQPVCPGVGLLVCYDVEHRDTLRALTERGARLVLVPTANPTGYEQVSVALLPAYAASSATTIVYANHCGSDEAYAYAGLSTVLGPDGAVLALAPADEEALLVVDVPTAAVE